MASPSDDQTGHSYRPVRPLPYTLNERARVSIEETLFPSAVEFLNSIVVPGTSTAPGSSRAAFIPPSTFQRCITTLIAHPYYTTQVSKNEPFPTAPANAYLLLRRMLRLVGPLNAEFAKAWEFNTYTRPARRGGRGTGRAGGRGRAREHDPAHTFSTNDDLNGDFATTESLFNVTDDFWSIVGWALTCSVSHPKRWEWWKLVLDLILDVVEKDWDDRLATKAVTGDENVLKQALFVTFLPGDTSSVGCKKVVRAIMTNAEEKSFNEWKEIWENELSTKRPRKIRMGTQDTAYMDDGDEESGGENGAGEDGDTEMQDADEVGAENEDFYSVSVEYGGMESIILRQRLLSMLSAVSHEGCYVPLLDLSIEFKETYVRLPLPCFQLFTNTLLDTNSSHKRPLIQFILSTIISTKAPVCDDPLTDKALIKNYLPFEANTTHAADNARVAVLVECLARLLFSAKMLEYSDELQHAVNKGIKARAAKVPKSYSKSGTQKFLLEREIRGVWRGAETRLKGLVEILKTQKGMA